MNPMELIQMIANGANPQQLAMTLLEQQAGNNPMFANLLKLAKNNQTKEIENFARNVCQEKGVDYDSEFNRFKNTLGIK